MVAVARFDRGRSRLPLRLAPAGQPGGSVPDHGETLDVDQQAHPLRPVERFARPRKRKRLWCLRLFEYALSPSQAASNRDREGESEHEFGREKSGRLRWAKGDFEDHRGVPERGGKKIVRNPRRI